MSSSASKSQSRNPRPQSQPKHSPTLTSHLAMVELKSRILSALSKLADRDTHQIAFEDLNSIITNLPSECIPMFINALIQDPHSDPSSIYKRESLRILNLVMSTHPEPVSTHLPKIMSHIVKRLKDNNGSDSIVRDACRDCVGGLGEVYLKNGGGDGGGLMIVGIFVKPLLEVIGEQSNNKNVAAGAAGCLGRLVEASAGGDKAGAMFQRLCPRICKLVGGQGVLAKGALLYVFSSLSQVGAIGPQSMPAVLQSIRDCLDNSDWATRKAAADTLIVLASYSSQLIVDGSASTIAALETCRFDKVKPVRDSMMEALQLWKNVAGKGDDQSENPKEEKARDSVDTEEKMENKKLTPGRKKSESLKDASSNTSPKGPDSVSKEKSSSIPEKILKKKTTSD